MLAELRCLLPAQPSLSFLVAFCDSAAMNLLPCMGPLRSQLLLLPNMLTVSSAWEITDQHHSVDQRKPAAFLQQDPAVLVTTLLLPWARHWNNCYSSMTDRLCVKSLLFLCLKLVWLRPRQGEERKVQEQPVSLHCKTWCGAFPSSGSPSMATPNWEETG